MKGYDERSARELNDIIRLSYIYGCFRRDQIKNILNVSKGRLNHQYGLINEIFNNDSYAVPDERIDGEVVLDYEKLRSDVNDLWKVYVEVIEEKEGSIKHFRRMQYQAAIRAALQSKEGFKLGDCQRCYDLLREDNPQEEEENYSRNSESSLRKALRELENLGVLKRQGQKYSLVSEPLPELTIEEGQELQAFLKYAINLIFPALPGYYLYQILQKKYPCRLTENQDCYYFRGYQAHAILDEGNYIELAECFMEEKIGKYKIVFDYIDNEESRLAVQKGAEKQRKEVLPYHILHDKSYGRTFLVGYCLGNQKMRGYRLDCMRNIQIKEEKHDIDLTGLYKETFQGTWSGGRTIEKERRKILLEIKNKEALGRIKREAITATRKGVIIEKEGKLYYEIVVPNPLDIKPWIMSLGKDVKIISITGEKTGKKYTGEPTELLEDVKETWRKMWELYESK
ncbi:MAG: helix-turn-helix transcriptional regulator [Lachnospiraceae bacterium]